MLSATVHSLLVYIATNAPTIPDRDLAKSIRISYVVERDHRCVLTEAGALAYEYGRTARGAMANA